MGVETAIALASAAGGSAATEAGRQAWQSLLALARRVTARGGEQEPEATVRDLTERARHDPGVAADLCGWAQTHRAAIHLDRSTVHNEVSGEARVSKLIQARDIQGDISF